MILTIGEDNINQSHLDFAKQQGEIASWALAADGTLVILIDDGNDVVASIEDLRLDIFHPEEIEFESYFGPDGPSFNANIEGLDALIIAYNEDYEGDLDAHPMIIWSKRYNQG